MHCEALTETVRRISAEQGLLLRVGCNAGDLKLQKLLFAKSKRMGKRMALYKTKLGR
jgi:hypothetical protein